MSEDGQTPGGLYAEHLDTLARGYAGALEAAGLEAVIIHSGTPQKRSEADDQHWPLRPVPEFQRWTPLAQPDCALVIRPGARPRLVWLRPESVWEQPPEPEWDGWQAHFDIDEVTGAEAARRYLPREGAAVIGERRTPPPWLAGQPLNPEVLVKALDDLRVTKTPYEVHCLREANRRAAVGHRRVAEAFRTGAAAEIDLHLLFLAATRQDDPETPYKNIIALGPHAATLHHVTYGRAVSGRAYESLLIDAGAAYLGYTSDVTRTYVKGSGPAADAFAELLRRVETMQQSLVAQAVPGLPYPALHERAHAAVARILSEMGILRMTAEEVVSRGLTRTFFPHGLGHSLGLQCHDVGCAEVPPTEATDWLRNTTTIAPGQVFTIEPGLYFIPARLRALREGPHAAAVDWPLVERLAEMGGIRIEDDIHVTGAPGRPVENLTRPWLP